MRKMKKGLIIAFLTICGNQLMAQDALIVDDEEFKVGKEVVAEVKDVKQGGFLGREKRLVNKKGETLLTLPSRTITDGNPPKYTNYAHIYVPALTDSIQINVDSLEADGVKIGLSYPDNEAWAEYLFRKKIVNPDGTLNLEMVKALKARYPIPAIQEYENKKAFANMCIKSINTATYRNLSVASLVTETSRNTNGDQVTITYKVEHEGVQLGNIVAVGHSINLDNERAEVDFKTKIFYKKADMEKKPMEFTITNNEGCKIAGYAPMSKVLMTSRADKGGSHGIMKPILDGKVETVKTRLEVLTAMADYLVKLGYY
jgi:hypothetical protein